MLKSIKFKIGIILILGFIIAFPWTVYQVIAHGWKAPESAAKTENPIPKSVEVLAAGKTLYEDFCTGCHGLSARGGSSESLGLEMNPPDLIKRLSGHSQGDFFWKIQNGKGDMPGFKNDLEPDEIWQIIHYIKNIIK